MVPKGWIEKPLVDFCPHRKYVIVDGPFGSNLKTIHYKTSGIPIVTSGHVTDGVFKAETYLYVDEDKFRQEIRSKVEGGDIVMAKIGANCGASAILPQKHPVSILSGNALKISIDEARNCTSYIWCYLDWLYKTKKLAPITSTGAQPAISIPSLKKLKIIAPEKPEQEEIARLLATWDDAIAKQEKLIDAKNRLKKGLMQKLLTGKVRFKEFGAPTTNGKLPQGWSQRKVRDLCQIIKGQGLSKDVVGNSGKYPCILYGELYTKYSEIIDKVESYTDKNEGITSHVGDVLLPGSTTTEGIDLANAAVLGKSGVKLGGDINILRQKTTNYSPKFLAYYLTHAKKREIVKLAQGITIVHLYGKQIADINLQMPPVSEQEKIAGVIEHCDAEIRLLKNKLIVLKKQKTSLMQKLLTGKIRVKA